MFLCSVLAEFDGRSGQRWPQPAIGRSERPQRQPECAATLWVLNFGNRRYKIFDSKLAVTAQLRDFAVLVRDSAVQLDHAGLLPLSAKAFIGAIGGFTSLRFATLKFCKLGVHLGEESVAVLALSSPQRSHARGALLAKGVCPQGVFLSVIFHQPQP
jgi:hypothetical protein